MQQIGMALTKAMANKKGKTRSLSNGTQVNLLDPLYLQPNPAADQEWQQQGSLAAELQEIEDVWRCPSVPAGGTSFGFNERLLALGARDGARIVLIEYNEPVADIVGQPFDDAWDNGDGIWDTNDTLAPRHFTMANAFTHGKSTSSYQPEEIDPNDCWSQKQYWVPNRDRVRNIAWGTAKADTTMYHDWETYTCPGDMCSQMVDRNDSTCPSCGQGLTPPQKEREDPYYGSCDWSAGS
jgi:hypothetical protein